MEWHVAGERADRIEYERADRFGRIVVRRTADGEWAVTLDLLEQAEDGPRYARETVADREAAEEQAAAWQDRYAGE